MLAARDSNRIVLTRVRADDILQIMLRASGQLCRSTGFPSAYCSGSLSQVDVLFGYLFRSLSSNTPVHSTHLHSSPHGTTHFVTRFQPHPFSPSPPASQISSEYLPGEVCIVSHAKLVLPAIYRLECILFSVTPDRIITQRRNCAKVRA